MLQKNNTNLSIVIPVFNEKKYLYKDPSHSPDDVAIYNELSSSTALTQAPKAKKQKVGLKTLLKFKKYFPLAPWIMYMGLICLPPEEGT